MLDINALDRILNQVIKETLEVLERRKTQVYEISENSRVELARVKEELAEVKSRVAEVVSRIDFVTSVEKKAQMKLTQLHISVIRSAQGELKKAYEEIYALKVESVKLKEEEKSLKRREEELELSLRQILAAVEKAEKMISQVGIVLNFLGSGLQNVTEKIGEVQQAQQMALSIMRAQEEERKRLAREIHDIPAQSMANIVMRAEYCLKLLDLDPAKVREELITLQNLVRSSLNDVRKIIFDLRPMALDDLGLVPATKRYLTEYKEQNAPQVEFFVFGLQRRLDSSVEVALFRIIQEAITNIKRHARAKSAAVKMEFLSDRIHIQISDDGRGFEPGRVMADKERDGYGLVGIRERVQLLKGEFNITSAPGQGTTIYISIPVD